MTTQIQIRRDTAANWNNVDPVLAEGEIGMDMTVNAFKVGDGVSAWSAIDYAGTDISLDDYYTKVETDDAFQPKGDYLTEFVEEDPTVPDHVKGITQDDIDGWNAGGGSGGTGSSVHIGENPPADPQEGQQWMEVPASGDATMWIYDGGKWLQQPGGKDGAAGADGNIADGTQDGIVATWNDTAGQWTPDSTVVVKGGKVGIGTDSPTFPLNVIGDARFQKSGVGGLTITIKDSAESPTGKGLVGLQSHNSSADLYVGGEPGNSFGGSTPKISLNSHTFCVETLGNERLTIDSSGNATFSGTVNGLNLKTAGVYREGFSGIWFAKDNWVGMSGDGSPTSGQISLGSSTDKFKDAYFSGTVNSTNTRSQRVIQDGSPVIDAKGLISTLSTLRNATKDETTLEGLRDSIGNAIGGLIEEFENQIAEMPAGDEA